MKNLFTFSSAVLLTYALPSQAQTILFQENFETSPVTSIHNTYIPDTQLPNAPVPCGKGSRGNTVNFNTTKVDFKSTQNASYFLGYNAQVPSCGGFSDATLATGTLNFSSMSSLKFKCRYFKSTTLNWGGTFLKVTFNSGAASFLIETAFTTTNNWDTLEITVPNAMISNSVTITFRIGGGEGVGLDDIKVIGTSVTSIYENSSNANVSVFPNPATSQAVFTFSTELKNAQLRLVDLSGKEVRNINFSGKHTTLERKSLQSGIYFYQIISEEKIFTNGSLVIQPME